MSMTSSPALQIRPKETAYDMFSTADALADSLEERLNENYEPSDVDDKETFDNFLDFFEKEATARRPSCVSPIDGSTRQNASPSQPWRKGLWCLNQKGALLAESAIGNKGCRSQNGTAAASPNAEGRSFVNFSHPLPRSQPLTPPHKETKRDSVTSAHAVRNSRRTPQPFTREGTLSPKSSYARNQQNGDMLYQASLQRHLQNFHLLAGDELETLSSPSRGARRQQERLGQVNAVTTARNGKTVHCPRLTTPPPDSDDPCPPIELGNMADDPGLDYFFSSEGPTTAWTGHEQTLNIADYIHNPHNQADRVWTEDSLSSPIRSEDALDMRHGYTYLGETQQLWSPQTTCASKADAPHSYQEHYPVVAAPAPHRPLRQLLHNLASPQIDGLGIRYPGVDSSTATHAYPTPLDLELASSYPPLHDIAPAERICTLGDASIFTTPRRHRPGELGPSRSISPCIPSGKAKYNYAATSRSLRQSSPTRQSVTARRKSIGAPKASSFTNSHHHGTSSTKTPRTPKTPAGSGAGLVGEVDFVNFTAKDSAKLLSDVAPSGSSKTRARREQEAREKRRRLSEAAVRAVRRAVRAAGADVRDGDVEALEKAILA